MKLTKRDLRRSIYRAVRNSDEILQACIKNSGLSYRVMQKQSPYQDYSIVFGTKEHWETIGSISQEGFAIIVSDNISRGITIETRDQLETVILGIVASRLSVLLARRRLSV